MYEYLKELHTFNAVSSLPLLWSGGAYRSMVYFSFIFAKLTWRCLLKCTKIEFLSLVKFLNDFSVDGQCWAFQRWKQQRRWRIILRASSNPPKFHWTTSCFRWDGLTEVFDFLKRSIVLGDQKIPLNQSMDGPNIFANMCRLFSQLFLSTFCFYLYTTDVLQV